MRRFEYVNREVELGIPGVRQAKQSYHPDHISSRFFRKAFPLPF